MFCHGLRTHYEGEANLLAKYCLYYTLLTMTFATVVAFSALT